jgi:hypothetical protein
MRAEADHLVLDTERRTIVKQGTQQLSKLPNRSTVYLIKINCFKKNIYKIGICMQYGYKLLIIFFYIKRKSRAINISPNITQQTKSTKHPMTSTVLLLFTVQNERKYVSSSSKKYDY